MESRTRARLQLVLAALLFSTGGAAIKSVAFSSWQIAALRSAIAAIAVWILAPEARRGWSWRTFVVAITYSITLILFVLANKLTTSANTIFLQSTAPLYLLLLGPWFLHEKVTRQDLLFMLIVGAGLGMFFVGREPAVATAPNPVLGNILAAVSGFTWAVTVVSLRWLGAHDPSPGAAKSAVVVGNGMAFLICLPFAWPFTYGTTQDWLLISYLGVFQIGVAYILVTAGLRQIPALEASVLLLVEPAFNPVWSWLVHHERPGNWALLGGGIIIATTVVKSVYDSRASRTG
ncbi:MAG: DMT family transporter [Gemmatimonadota bacterium]